MNKDYPIGSICEDYSGNSFEIVAHPHNPVYLTVVNLADPKKRKQSIGLSKIKQIISNPLPLAIGDRVVDEDNQAGEVVAISSKSIEIQKSNTITSHNLEEGLPSLKKIEKKSQQFSLIPRGGRREGAGRKPTGKPPKKRKAIQLDLDLAAILPDLKMLAQLIEEFRPIAQDGKLRSQKLADFYKKLDALPKIANENL